MGEENQETTVRKWRRLSRRHSDGRLRDGKIDQEKCCRERHWFRKLKAVKKRDSRKNNTREEEKKRRTNNVRLILRQKSGQAAPGGMWKRCKISERGGRRGYRRRDAYSCWSKKGCRVEGRRRWRKGEEGNYMHVIPIRFVPATGKRPRNFSFVVSRTAARLDLPLIEHAQHVGYTCHVLSTVPTSSGSGPFFRPGRFDLFQS